MKILNQYYNEIVVSSPQRKNAIIESNLSRRMQPSAVFIDDELFLQVKIKIQNQEYTAELNELIEKLLTFGETNYTCWVAKKRILMAGHTTIEHEDEFSQEVLLDNLKNFQLWDYRNFIYDNTKDHEKQYALMDRILEESPKNYHLWSNRTRLVGIVKNFTQEISRTQKYIEKDYYNNSAWTYRAFCFQHLAIKDYKGEIKFTLDKIEKYIQNEAAWNYLRGFFPCYKLKDTKFQSFQQKKFLNYDDYPQIKQFCHKIVGKKQIKDFMKVQAFLTMVIMDSQKPETVQYAQQVCKLLAEIEPMRVTFYNWLRVSM